MIVAEILVAADEAPGESAKFNGTWVLIRVDLSRIAMPDVISNSSMVINGNKLATRLGQETFEGTHRFDPNQDPKACDRTVTSGPNKGTKQYGIYRLDGDELTICSASSGFPRPKEFKAPDGSNATLIVWKRQSK
jgi:uncharacterized protein (TIGR03067 family)